jgi:hypothetical protein
MESLKMRDGSHRIGRVLVSTLVALALGSPALTLAQSGKIVCWKDSAGKVIGCGDKLPPEYQGSATKELDSRGITRRQTESVEEAARRRQREQEAARLKAEEERKSIVQKRQDTALLETYSNEKEIDVKRDRDLQVLDLQIEQMTMALKNTTQRYNEARGRAEMLEKNKKPLPPTLKEEIARLSSEKERFEQSIAAKHREKEELRVRYAEYRKRYTELRAEQLSAAKR